VSGLVVLSNDSALVGVALGGLPTSTARNCTTEPWESTMAHSRTLAPRWVLPSNTRSQSALLASTVGGAIGVIARVASGGARCAKAHGLVAVGATSADLALQSDAMHTAVSASLVNRTIWAHLVGPAARFGRASSRSLVLDGVQAVDNGTTIELLGPAASEAFGRLDPAGDLGLRDAGSVPLPCQALILGGQSHWRTVTPPGDAVSCPAWQDGTRLGSANRLHLMTMHESTHGGDGLAIRYRCSNGSESTTSV